MTCRRRKLSQCLCTACTQFLEICCLVLPRVHEISEYWCKGAKWYYVFAPQAAALATSCIALDRLMALMTPFFYNERATEPVGFVISSISLAIAAAVAVPSLIFNTHHEETSFCGIDEEYDFVSEFQFFFGKK